MIEVGVAQGVEVEIGRGGETVDAIEKTGRPETVHHEIDHLKGLGIDLYLHVKDQGKETDLVIGPKKGQEIGHEIETGIEVIGETGKNRNLEDDTAHLLETTKAKSKKK
jgi:hypothetical protein